MNIFVFALGKPMNNLNLMFRDRSMRKCLNSQKNGRRRHNMGAKNQCLNSHPDQPNNHTTSPFSVIHLYPNSMLPKLGLPTSPLHQILFFYSSQMGHLSLPQKGLQIWAPWNFLEVQVPISDPSTIDSCKRSRGSSVGSRAEETEF